MAKGVAPLDEERLPWLEPYRDVIARKQKVARRSHGGLVAVAAGLGVLFAAGGGYWLGQRWGEPAPEPVIRTAEAPVTTAPVVPPASTAPAPSEESPPATTTTQPAAKKSAAATPKKTVRRAVRQRKIRTAGIENARIREVRAAQERAAAPAPPSPPPAVAQANARPWPKMPSPGPAGQVVQLGAFRTEGRALAAYRSRLARYPVLASMPRVVVPVVTKPRGKVLYVLRLGTASRQQSRIVCRNLRASGDHCIVIG